MLQRTRKKARAFGKEQPGRVAGAAMMKGNDEVESELRFGRNDDGTRRTVRPHPPCAIVRGSLGS